MSLLTKRLIGVTVYVILIIAGYKLIESYVHGVGPIFKDFRLPGEDNIPFIPEMLPVYLSIYFAAPFLLFIVKRERHFLAAVKAFGAATLVHYFFFALLPIENSLRPSLPQAGGYLIEAMRLMYSADGLYNNFPSMHVSFAFLMYFCVRHAGSRFAPHYLALAFAIALSTVLVKQHYVMDVVSAVPLAWGVRRVFLV